MSNYKFKIGDRVVVVSECATTGRYGTVKACCNVWGRQYTVKIDGVSGKRTYNEESLRLIEDYEREKEWKIMAKLTGYHKVAEITISGRSYYYALYDDDIGMGDKVLVTGKCEGYVYTVANVWSLQDAVERYKGTICEEVICKVDRSAYEKRVVNRAEKDKIRKEMDAMIKQMDEAQKYRMYADQNPQLAELLKKFENLEG